jgi:hypothetical protein
MAQEFDGPVTINGELTVKGPNNQTFTVKDALHANPAFVVDFVNAQFDNIKAFGEIHATASMSCDSLTCNKIVANRADHIVTLEGGFATTVDLVVRGSAAVNHDLEVGGNVHVKGDISLINGDCAEDFTIASGFSIDAGTVVVLGPDGSLSPSEVPYDKRVVGVISGAGDYKPAIVLDRKPSPENRQPVALIGKAFCDVDASYGAIEIGDLLTTSPTPGHAMKAADPVQAFGAVLGKALRPLSEGRGLIPVLVTLQ